MPTRTEPLKFKILLSVKSLSNVFAQIKKGLDNEGSLDLNEDNQAVLEQARKALFEAERKIDGISSNWVDINSNISLRKIDSLWRSFNRYNSVSQSKEVVKRYVTLLQSTIDFLSSLRIKPSGEPSGVSYRTKSSQEEQTRLTELNERRLEIKYQYEQALKEDPLIEEKVQALKAQLEAIEVKIIGKKKVIDEIKTDNAEEEQMRKRIDAAFDSLSNDNHLESELNKLRWEYYVMLILIALVVLAFFVFYGIFLCHLNSLKLNSWCEYMPYTMSVPIAVALLWLFVYLKNRASKISIELGSRLYDIRYLEGLMKMTNSMSKTSAEASENIEEIIHSLIDSFMEKMSEKPLKERELSAIEKQELEDSPYWKILCELKDLVKQTKK